MKVILSPELKKDAEKSSLVQRFTPFVKKQLASAGADARWELIDDHRHRPYLCFRLIDPARNRVSSNVEFYELNEQFLDSKITQLKSAMTYIEHWREVLHALYADIKKWCRKLKGKVTFEEGTVTCNEVLSGEYDVPMLIVKNRGETMIVQPIAAWMMGYDGRVDLTGIGEHDILGYSKPSKNWYYLDQNMTAPEQQLLDEDLFLELVEPMFDV